MRCATQTLPVVVLMCSEETKLARDSANASFDRLTAAVIGSESSSSADEVKRSLEQQAVTLIADAVRAVEKAPEVCVCRLLCVSFVICVRVVVSEPSQA